MKTNLAKKIIKILTLAVFSVFVLTLFNFEMVNGANFTNSSSSLNSAFMQNVSSSSSAENTSSEDTNPYTNPGESATGIEQSSTDNDQNNDGTNDAFETDNPANFQTMDGETDSSGKKFTYTLLQPLPQEGEDLQKNVTLKEYLTWAFRFTLALAGFLAVMMIVIGGVEYIISGANESMRGEAHKRISNAIYGLILALVSYLVLYTINPSLVDFKNNQFFKEKTTSSENSNNSSSDNSSSEGDYSSTGAALTSEEKNTSSANAEGYEVSKNVIITNYEDESESYAITETYTDKDGNIYTTRTTKDKEDVFSTKKYVQYIGQSEETLISEDESNPNYDFSGWDGS